VSGLPRGVTNGKKTATRFVARTLVARLGDEQPLECRCCCPLHTSGLAKLSTGGTDRCAEIESEKRSITLKLKLVRPYPLSRSHLSPLDRQQPAVSRDYCKRSM